MTPVTCLITDRGRLGPGWEAVLIARIAAAAHAGVHLIQIRERDLDSRRLFQLIEQSVIAVRGTASRIVVNDRLDVAMLAGAHGVHLRGDSMDPQRVRATVPRPFLVGRSVHGVEEAGTVGASGAVDYLIFGHVFETVSKPGLDAAGLRALTESVRATTTPVLAVGGISATRVCDVAAAGAAGIAAIGLFVDPPIAALPAVVVGVNRAFDTHEGVT